MDEDKKAELKSSISTAFNGVSGKVVRIKDLVSAFDGVASKRLGFLERMVAKKKIDQLSEKADQLAESDIERSGFYKRTNQSGQTELYVESAYIKNTMLRAIDRGDTDGYEESVKKAGLATAEALAKVPDHSATVKNRPPALK